MLLLLLSGLLLSIDVGAGVAEDVLEAAGDVGDGRLDGAGDLLDIVRSLVLLFLSGGGGLNLIDVFGAVEVVNLLVNEALEVKLEGTFLLELLEIVILFLVDHADDLQGSQIRSSDLQEGVVLVDVLSLAALAQVIILADGAFVSRSDDGVSLTSVAGNA